MRHTHTHTHTHKNLVLGRRRAGQGRRQGVVGRTGMGKGRVRGWGTSKGREKEEAGVGDRMEWKGRV